MSMLKFLVMAVACIMMLNCAESWDSSSKEKEPCENFEYRCKVNQPQQCLFNVWFNTEDNCPDLGDEWKCAIMQDNVATCYDDLCRYEGEFRYVDCASFGTYRQKQVCRDGRWKNEGLCE